MDRQTKLDVLQKELGKPYYGEHYVALDALLSDVLVWGIKKGLYMEIGLDKTFSIRWDNANTYETDYKEIIINRDLTKSYLSEQSDEVIYGLYEVFLLTNKD